MTDLSKLAAQRCAELANEESARRNRRSVWAETDFNDGGSIDSLAFRERLIADHHTATAILARHPDLADDLKSLVLVEPVDPVEERAREVWGDIATTRSDAEAIAIIANALRQGADHAG